jgi:hypothetical protein
VGKLTTKASEQTDEPSTDEVEQPASVNVEDLVEAILGGVSRATAARERTATNGTGGLPRPRPWDPNWPWTIIVGFWDPPTGSGPWEGGGQDPGGDDPIPL